MYLTALALAILLSCSCVIKTSDTCTYSIRGIPGNHTCRPNWRPWGGSCYFLTKDNDWSGANDACVEMGGALAAPWSEEENGFLAGIIKESGRHWVWINCDDVEIEGNWRCSTGGMESHFRKWAGGEGRTGHEDCAFMNADGYWGDRSCQEVSLAVCKSIIRPTLHL